MHSIQKIRLELVLHKFVEVRFMFVPIHSMQKVQLVFVRGGNIGERSMASTRKVRFIERTRPEPSSIWIHFGQTAGERSMVRRASNFVRFPAGYRATILK